MRKHFKNPSLQTPKSTKLFNFSAILQSIEAFVWETAGVFSKTAIGYRVQSLLKYEPARNVYKKVYKIFKNENFGLFNYSCRSNEPFTIKCVDFFLKQSACLLRSFTVFEVYELPKFDFFSTTLGSLWVSFLKLNCSSPSKNVLDNAFVHCWTFSISKNWETLHRNIDFGCFIFRVILEEFLKQNTATLTSN